MESDLNICCRMVTSVFPDISPDYARQISLEQSGDSGLAINVIMDYLEEGKLYPKKSVACLKRKRDRTTIDEADPRMTELKRKYSYIFLREKTQSAEDIAQVEQVLRKHFVLLPKDIIVQTMSQFDNLLLPTYLDLEEKLRNWDLYTPKPWPNLAANVPKDSTEFLATLVKDTCSIRPTVLSAQGNVDQDLYRELLSAIRIRNSRVKKLESQKKKENQLDEEAMTSGFVGECGCCYTDFPLHRMVQCDGHQEHMFCYQCARRTAEAQIGLARWRLQCMSTDGCSGGFSQHERSKFLDSKLMEALDRIETDSVLNLAGLTLAKCPFCPFAAEYPDIKQDREFRCENEACMKVSCRLCDKESHIPKTCEESRIDGSRPARLRIEEAMSHAMIRICNKCKTPFIKDDGCNKMNCPVPSCGNMQCYVCSTNCDYNHFAQKHDRTEDGQKCPLYDDSEARHAKEVKTAQERTTKEVQSEKPEAVPEALKINMSDRVLEDDERRRRVNNPEARRLRQPDEAALGRQVRGAQRVMIQPQQPPVPAEMAVEPPAVPHLPLHEIGAAAGIEHPGRMSGFLRALRARHRSAPKPTAIEKNDKDEKKSDNEKFTTGRHQLF